MSRLDQRLLAIDLTAQQRELVDSAWDVDPEQVWKAIWDAEHSTSKANYLTTACRRILTETDTDPVEVPVRLMALIRNDIYEALTLGQRRVLVEAWSVHDQELRHAMAAVERGDAPVRVLMRVCDRIIAEYGGGDPNYIPPQVTAVNFPPGITYAEFQAMQKES